MQTRKSGSMKKDMAEYGAAGVHAALAGESTKPMKPRVVGKQAAEAQQTAAPSLATRLAAVRGDYARRTGDTAGAMPKPEKPVPAMDYSKMKKPPVVAAKSSALGKAGEVRLPGASPSRSSPPVPTSLRKLSISKLVERKKQGITHLGSRDFVAKKAAKGFQIVSLDDAYAFMKAGEAPPAPQGSGPPKKFPRRDKTPNVLGKPMKKAEPLKLRIGSHAMEATKHANDTGKPLHHARAASLHVKAAEAYMDHDDMGQAMAHHGLAHYHHEASGVGEKMSLLDAYGRGSGAKKALATGYGKVSGGGALKAPNRGFPVEKGVEKGPGGFKPTPLAARAPQAAQRSPAPQHGKPINLDIGPVEVRDAPKQGKPINLDIGPATVTSLGPPKPPQRGKPINLDIGPATVTSLGPPKPAQVAARKGLSIADLQQARKAVPPGGYVASKNPLQRPPKKPEPAIEYRHPSTQARAHARYKKFMDRKAVTKASSRPTAVSKKSPRVLDDGGAALMGSMPPPTLMKPNNVVQKSKGTSMSKTNFNNLFKSELGIPNDEVLCDCPHCDSPITKSDLVAKASGGEMVVSQNPTGGTMRGGEGRGVLTPSRGVPGAKQTDEVRMVGDKSKKKLVSKAHDSDSCSDDASSGDALSGAPPKKKMSKSTVRGTDFVQYIDYAGAPGSDAAIAKSIAEGAIGQQPTQPMDLNNDLTRLLV